MKTHTNFARLLRFTFALSFVFGATVFAHAQNTSAPARPPQQPTAAQPASANEQDGGKVVIDVRRVSLPISVLDKKGAPVGGLSRSDFLVLEDKQPQSIESFAVESNNLPLYVAVMMDTSGSTAGKLAFEKESALNFIHTIARIRKDQIAFGTFDDEVKLLQDFTTKLDLLDKAINNVKKPGVQTSLYNAIWRVCDEKMRGVRGLRAIVVITDGDDTREQVTLDEAIGIAQNTETMVFAISTKAGFSGVVTGVEAGQVKDSGDKKLERLAQETGGRAFFTGDKLALERSFKKIAEELRAQYIVSYRPTNENYDGNFRRIEVKLAQKRDGMKVRTRRGYRATRRATDTQ